jgi:hypothetical protein
MGKDLEIGVSRIPLQLEDLSSKGLTKIASTDGEKFSEIKSKKDDEKLQKGQVELDSVKPNGDLRNKVADLMGLITNSTDPKIESVVCDIPNGISKVSDMKVKALFDNKETPYLELSLKRLRDVGDTETSAQDQNILRHSELSAFSRYRGTSNSDYIHLLTRQSSKFLFMKIILIAGIILLQLGMTIAVLLIIAQRQLKLNQGKIFNLTQMAHIPIRVPMAVVTTMTWAPLLIMFLPNKWHSVTCQCLNLQLKVSIPPLHSNQCKVAIFLPLSL